MKYLYILTLTTFLSSYSFCQNNMNVGVLNDNGELVVSITYDGNIPAGNLGGLPTSNDFISDFTITLKWPNSAGVNLDNVITSSLGTNTIVKVNSETVQGSDEYQRFRLNSSVQLPSNMVVNQAYEIFRINFTAATPMTGQVVEVAPQGFLPAGLGGNTQPNTSVDYNGAGDVEDFLPMDITQFAPLPIDIKTFSATKDGDRNARLDWSTSLEINAAYFGIERSIDGTTWEGISKVAAAGNSNTEQFYTYTDRDLPLNRSKDQIFYYRLQLVDLDGQYKYSDIRGVNFGKAETDKLISLYPNPAVQMVNIDLSGMDLESGAIHLSVTDMQGRNMIDKTILGNGIEPIEVTQLPVGTYNVAVSQGANLYQKQFIKIE